MSKKTVLIWLTMCVLSVNSLVAQNLTFNSTNFDFGAIAEDGGNVSHTFTLKNSGDAPMVIVTASSSCGCTIPEYSRAPIAPSASSEIKVIYDPMDRPGKFSKTVQIIVAPGNKRYTLTITGDVTPRERSVEELYPFDMGSGFRMSANYYPFSLIEQGERLESQVKYTNTSSKSVKVTLHSIDASQKLDRPSTIRVAPGGVGSFAIAYDMAKHKGYYGVLSDRLEVKVSGKRSKYDLIISGNAIDAFTDDQRSTPPICNLSSRIVRLGLVKKGKASQKQSLTIENTGVSDLIIRDVACGDGVMTSIKSGMRVKPSEVAKFDIWIDGNVANFGNFAQYITLTVNDPDSPVQRVRVLGSVEK